SLQPFASLGDRGGYREDPRYIGRHAPGVKAGNGRRRKERRRGPDRVPRLQIPRPRPGGGVVKGPPSPSPGWWGGGGGCRQFPVPALHGGTTPLVRAEAMARPR